MIVERIVGQARRLPIYATASGPPARSLRLGESACPTNRLSGEKRTNETTATKNGKVVMTDVSAVAKDGKSRTVTPTRTDAKGEKITNRTYYDKE